MILTRSDSTSSFIDEEIAGSDIYKPRAPLNGREDSTASFAFRLQAITDEVLQKAKHTHAPKGIIKLSELVEGKRIQEGQEKDFHGYSIHDQIGILIDFMEGRKIGAPLPWFAKFKWFANWSKIQRSPETQEFYLQLFSKLKNLYRHTGLYQSCSEGLSDESDAFLASIYTEALRISLSPEKNLSDIELRKIQKALERIESIYRSNLESIKQLEVLHNNALIRAQKESKQRQKDLLQHQSETLNSLIQKFKIYQETFIQSLQNSDTLISESMHRNLKHHHFEQQQSTHLAGFLKELDVTESALNDFFKDDDQLSYNVSEDIKKLRDTTLVYFSMPLVERSITNWHNVLSTLQERLSFWSKQIHASTQDIATKNLHLNRLHHLVDTFFPPKALSGSLLKYQMHCYSKTLENKKIIEDIVQLTSHYYHALADTRQMGSIPHTVKMMSDLFEGKTKIDMQDEKRKTIKLKWSELNYRQKDRVLRTKAPTFFGRIQTPAFAESNNDFVKEHDAALINILDQAGFIQKF